MVDKMMFVSTLFSGEMDINLMKEPVITIMDEFRDMLLTSNPDSPLLVWKGLFG